jgi:hypothetical protein
LRDAQAHDDITTGFGAALRKFIAHQGDLTKTGTTPAPIQLELPLTICRELTAAERTSLDPFATFAKAPANATARVWRNTASEPPRRWNSSSPLKLTGGTKFTEPPAQPGQPGRYSAAAPNHDAVPTTRDCRKLRRREY